MTEKIVLLLLLVLAVLFATGCIGSNGLTNEVLDWNLELTESPGWRATWGFCLLPVYWVTGWLDLIVFNSIEFWSGSNPINGKPRLVDRDMNAPAPDTTQAGAEHL